MNKKLITISSIFVIIVFFSIFIISSNKNGTLAENEKASGVQTNTLTNEGTPLPENVAKNVNNPDIILFYGGGCPHCALVEEYVNQNGIEAKVPFTKKEVYYNQNNAKELESKAKACGMSTDSIGVPFLWDGSKCLVGDQDIIEFFKLKAK